MTWQDYGEGLDERLADLENRLHRGSYRAQPSRRPFIPKADGRLRPFGIAALEDKIVQRAVAEILNAIYEEDFLDLSYGFRPGRGQHDALNALAVGINGGRVNRVLDADIQAFFDNIDHDWMMRLLEHRIGDRRISRLIRIRRFVGASQGAETPQWLTVGVIGEDGVRHETAHTQGRSRMPKLGTYGSVRGLPGMGVPTAIGPAGHTLTIPPRQAANRPIQSRGALHGPRQPWGPRQPGRRQPWGPRQPGRRQHRPDRPRAGSGPRDRRRGR